MFRVNVEKKQACGGEEGGDCTQVKVEMIGECMDVVGSFKSSEICFSKDGGP